MAPERLGGVSDRLPPRYTYLRCRDCQAAYLSELPRAEHLALYYESAAYHFSSGGGRGPGHRDTLSAFRRLHLRLARPLPRARPGRLLDFGCGPGDYLAFARSFGWDATGVEYSDQSAATARGRGFRVVLESELEKTPGPPFDLISMIHSLEHVPRPVATLHEFVRRLAPGGLLFVELPYLDCHEFRLFGRHYSMIQAPVHLQFFADTTMRRLGKQLGLRLLRAANNLLTPVHYVWSLLNLFEAATGAVLGRRLKTLVNALTFPAAVVPAAVTSLLGMSGACRQYLFQHTS